MFDLRRCKQIYMCGDTHVCTKSCSEERYFELRNIDPGFTRPHTWPLIKSTTKDSIFNSELVLKSSSHSVPNVKEHIFKAQGDIYDDYEQDEMSLSLLRIYQDNDNEDDFDFPEIIQNRFKSFMSSMFYRWHTRVVCTLYHYCIRTLNKVFQYYHCNYCYLYNIFLMSYNPTTKPLNNENVVSLVVYLSNKIYRGKTFLKIYHTNYCKYKLL